MTPFEEAGYTKDTKFKVVRDIGFHIKEGDIVTLRRDDGSYCPYFKTGEGKGVYLCLPGMAADGYEELEVYEEPKECLKKETLTDNTTTTLDKYEYLVERITDSLITDFDLKSRFDDLGEQGWELCNSSGSKFIFKRLIK